MKVAIRILCTVALLVQCATCNRAEDTKHLEVVIAVLHSYYAFYNTSQQKYNLHLDSIQSHLHLLEHSNAFELKFDKVTQKSWYGQSLHFGPGYCPTTTMLACGEADVPVEFCLQLLHRAKVFVEASKDHLNSLKLAPEDEVDAKPESMPTVGSSRKSVRTLFSKPVASSRQRRASLVKREQELIAEVQALLMNRPIPEAEMLVEEKQNMLYIQHTELTHEKDRLTIELEELGEGEELMEEKQKLTHQLKEVEKRRDAIIDESPPKLDPNWQVALVEERGLQMQRSIETLTALSQFPYDRNNDEVSKAWLGGQSHNFIDFATNCYPEQFIVCGQHVEAQESLAKKNGASWTVVNDQRAAAVRKCINTIRKYNGFRQMAHSVLEATSRR